MIAEWMIGLQAWGGAPLWLALALGTALGLPVLPLYVLAGGVWGTTALPLVAAGLVAHLAVVYAVYRILWRRGGRAIVERWLPSGLRTRLSLLGPRQMTLVVRALPGVPLFAQSYLLAFAGVPWGVCTVWTLVVQLPLAWMATTAGQAAAKDNWIVFTLGLIAAVGLSWLWNQLSKKWAAKNR